MAIEHKDREQLVIDVIERLKQTLPSNVDYSTGEPLRTIIEAVMQELDIQYWQMEQIYDSAFIDTAVSEDLDKLVKLLGIYRSSGASSIGEVEFSRVTPAAVDYFIPEGTLVSTLPNSDGEVFEFETLENVTMRAGETSISAPVHSLYYGYKYNIPAYTITVINTPPIGIESVINKRGTTGGFDIETDEDLRKRAENALDSSGLATIGALTDHLLNIKSVEQVKVYEYIRGIGTVDIIVVGNTIPMPSELLQNCIDESENVKAAGIDVLLYEPTLIPLDIDVILTMQQGFQMELVRSSVIKSIDSYINNLNINEPLILNQLERAILNTSARIIDVEVVGISGNLYADYSEIFRTNSIEVR